MNSHSKPTFVIRTLGCKVNQYESQAMREHLIRHGLLEEKDSRACDFYFVNSCTVTHRADRETRNLIHHFHRINPKGKIVVAGCYAELENDRKKLFDIPGVAHLVRNSEKEKITDILSLSKNYQPSALSPRITDFKDRNRAFVKVQDGCNHKCSYCKVSLVRGPSRSRDTEEILKEARSIVEKGFKEIVLTGVCLGAWGKDLPKKMTLSDLIKEILQIEGFFRVRLSSIEPMYVTDDIVNALCNNEKLCKHLHIPLQSGDDRILKAMKRPYNTKRIKKLVRKIRKRIPDIAITTDMLVGFPGEGDKEFLNTVKFIRYLRPSRVHVFSYSRREGTPAAALNYDTDKKIIKERTSILTKLCDNLSMDFAKQFIGTTQNILIENQRGNATGHLCGYTDRYVRVFVNGSDSLKNKLTPINITRTDEAKNTVFGHLDNRQII